ncbi:peptidyl-prolyl cis-trans isomerase SurA [Rhizobium paknamense]|uniref:Peptidyl-prolyl cis-trans isomerase SurA n=2 Tax=Rhizobium paknamense TaxID=1206817 RepID=A0ABU0I7D9_9HYPH|nr:peptidyl-prolyl cis-trans isomerase SurA [Rhizobium paknamense]
MAMLGTVAFAGVTGFGPASVRPALAATDVAAVVNKVAITSGDVARRMAFLKLRHETGNLQQKAKEEMIDEQLKRQEIARVGMSVSTDEVDAAFARFSNSNKLSVQQMTQILDRAGVGAEHFKNYIAVQMSWPRLVNARYGKNKMTNQEMVTKMLESKQKPVTTEYYLKQVIFVVPTAKRNAIMGKRQAEAEASRGKFPGCDQAMDFARNYLDVSIRDLGRVMKPELPPDWAPLIENAKGNTTGTRVTDRGVEYLAICNQRQVSDDLAAEAVFRAEDIGKAQQSKSDPNSDKYLAELKSKAQIIEH